MKALLASPRLRELGSLTTALEAQPELTLESVSSARELLDRLGPRAYELIIIDEAFTSPPLAELLTASLNADVFVNLAVISELSEDQFHDVYEGFGLVGGFSPDGGASQVEGVLEDLRTIMGAMPAGPGSA